MDKFLVPRPSSGPSSGLQSTLLDVVSASQGRRHVTLPLPLCLFLHITGKNTSVASGQSGPLNRRLLAVIA